MRVGPPTRTIPFKLCLSYDCAENQFAQLGCLGDDRGDERFEELAVDGAAEADGLAVAAAAQLGDLEGHLLLFREGDSIRSASAASRRTPCSWRGQCGGNHRDDPLREHALGGPPGEHAIEVLATEMIVAVVVEHLEPAGSRPDERDVKCAATEVVNQPVAVAGEARAACAMAAAIGSCSRARARSRRARRPGVWLRTPRAGTSPAP